MLPVACIAIYELRGSSVGDRRAYGDPQILSEPGDNGQGLRTLAVGEVVRGL